MRAHWCGVMSQVTKYFARLKDVRAKRLALDEALREAAGELRHGLQQSLPCVYTIRGHVEGAWPRTQT